MSIRKPQNRKMTSPSGSLLQTLIDVCPHGVVVKDGDVLVCKNNAWDRLMQRATKDSEASSFGEIARDSGISDVSVSSKTVNHNGRKLSLTVARDIREQRRLEQQLLESQKLEALGRWVGGVVHDFNNLLTAVMLYSDIVSQRAEPGSAIAKYNGEIREVAKRGAGLTGQLLSFVQQRPCECAVVSANCLVKGLRDVLEKMVGEGIQFVCELAPEACCIKIDPAQLQQIIFNLVLNARDATPSGGKICISTLETDAVIGSSRRPAVQLRVTDNGVGMDSCTLGHIFEPFFTTKPEGKGTGLGLTIVQEIVSACGGNVSVSSKPGAGTEMTVTFPRAESSGPCGNRLSDVRLEERGTETLLVVEDDARVRASIADVLEQCGYSVLRAKNGVEAIDRARDFDGEIDLLVTDLVLPGMSGKELARFFQNDRPETRVIFISGYAPEMKDSSGDHIFEKPFNLEGLIREIHEALSKGTTASQTIGRE